VGVTIGDYTLAGATTDRRWMNLRVMACPGCHRKVRGLEIAYWLVMAVGFGPLVVAGAIAFFVGSRPPADSPLWVLFIAAALLLPLGFAGWALVARQRKRFVRNSSLRDVGNLLGPALGLGPADHSMIEVTPLATISPTESVLPLDEVVRGQDLRAWLSAAATARETMPRPTRWTAPVAPAAWPRSRWLVQLGCGLFLSVLFALGWFAGKEVWCGPFFGVPLALALAATLNGLVVARRMRRLRALSVLIIFLLVLGLGLVLVPPLGFWVHATFARLQGDNARMQEVLSQVRKHHPNDVRFVPAERMALAGLRRQYETPLAALAAEPAAGQPVDADFRRAFRELLEDVAGRGDPTVYVALHESFDATPPPRAQLELLLWERDPDLTGLLGPKSRPRVVDLPAAFSADQFNERAKQLAAALQKQLGPLVPKDLIKLVPLGSADRAGNLLLDCHAQARHSGQFLKQTRTIHGPHFARYSVLLVLPETTWEIKVIDRQGRVLGTTTLTVAAPGRFEWAQEVESGEGLNDYYRVLFVAHARMAWQFARRLGLDGGEEPTRFP
jgi:hypothetical protein